jgi:hypothetical protein
MMKRVEHCVGTGALKYRDRVYPNVGYRIDRYQGMARSGLPVPGLHRIEGSIDLGGIDAAGLVGPSLTLTLEDGRAIGITLAGLDGRVYTEGHGPSRCSCC